MAARVQLREITSDEGNRLLRIVRRTSGSVRRGVAPRSCCSPRRACPRPRSVGSSSPTRTRSGTSSTTSTGTGSTRSTRAIRGWRPQTFTLPKRPGDQADRADRPARSGSAVCDLEPVEARGLPGRQGGGHGHLPRGAASAPSRGGRPLSSREDVEALDRPGFQGQARPDRPALRAGRGRRGGRGLPPMSSGR